MFKKLFNTNFFAWVIKGALGGATLILSAILSYSFFLAIEPNGMAVFPFAALTLTEGGFIGWILIFSLMKHHQITSIIALVMIALSFITTIVVTFAELIQLFQDHTLVSNATVENGTLILLEVMLALHILAVASDFLVIKIEWLIREYIPPGDNPRGGMIAESHSPTAAPVTQQLQPSTRVQPTVHVDQRTTQQDLQDWVSVWMDSTDRQEGMPFLPWLEDLGNEHVKDETMALARRLYPVKAAQPGTPVQSAHDPVMDALQSSSVPPDEMIELIDTAVRYGKMTKEQASPLLQALRGSQAISQSNGNGKA